MTKIYVIDGKEISSDELVGARVVSRALGLSLPTVRGMASRRELPLYKIGHSVRFDLEEIFQWRNERREEARRGRMTHLFLDCEFNGFGGELISMAIYDARFGLSFYEVLPFHHMEIDPWVAENVIPVLDREPLSSTEEFQQELEIFLLRYRQEEVTIIFDWPDDISYFCTSLLTQPGEAIQTPARMSMILDRRLSSGASEVPHNALADAKAIAQHYLAAA